MKTGLNMGKKLALTSLIALQIAAPLSAGVAAEEAKRGPIKIHQMNPAVASCLEDLNQNCALTAAVKTVTEEQQAMERAKVLLAVAESMITLGQKDRAKRVLDMAIEAAESTKLSIAMTVTLREAIPLFARLGYFDVTGNLLSKVDNQGLKDDLVMQVLREKAAQDLTYAEMMTWAKLISSPEKAFWATLKVMEEEGINLSAIALNDLGLQVEKQTTFAKKFRARASYAAILWKNGERQKAQTLFDKLDADFVLINAPSAKAQLASSKLAAMFNAGVDNGALTTMLDFTKKQAVSINDPDEKARFAERVGPVEIKLGRVGSAVIRSVYFQDLMTQVEYVEKLAELTGKPADEISQRIDYLANQLSTIEDSYERDVYRYRLLRSALSIKDKGLVKQLIQSMEDDDNQARGLALLAAIL